MTPPRVLVLVGTRPEAIKMAPVVEALRERPELEGRLALTGQHSELVDGVLGAFGLEPDHDLAIMREGQTLYQVAAACLDGMREVLGASEPDVVLVQGDTASAFFSALTGFFERIRVGHVEAGLRSGDKWSPFPEEMFRRLADDVSDWHFAPTPEARDNLLASGIDERGVHLTGNTVVDALERLRSGAPGAPENRTLRELLAGEGRLVLLTMHRRESFGEPIRRALGAIRRLVDEREDVELLYPVHPNPEVAGPAAEILSDHPRLHLTEPLGYFDLLRALGAAELVLTDSGGIQEEAPSFGVPVLVLREVTERPEGIRAGVARLVGTDPDGIRVEALRLLDDPEARRAMVASANPYGDGRAAERIVDVLAADLCGCPRRTGEWSG